MGAMVHDIIGNHHMCPSVHSPLSHARNVEKQTHSYHYLDFEPLPTERAKDRTQGHKCGIPVQCPEQVQSQGFNDLEATKGLPSILYRPQQLQTFWCPVPITATATVPYISSLPQSKIRKDLGPAYVFSKHGPRFLSPIYDPPYFWEHQKWTSNVWKPPYGSMTQAPVSECQGPYPGFLSTASSSRNWLSTRTPKGSMDPLPQNKGGRLPNKGLPRTLWVCLPAPPNYPLRHPKYHLIETRRPLVELHCGGLGRVYIGLLGSLPPFSLRPFWILDPGWRSVRSLFETLGLRTALGVWTGTLLYMEPTERWGTPLNG